jgi:hypothetical protein
MHVICTEINSTQMQQSSSGQYKWWIRKTCQSKVTDAYNPTARRGTMALSTPRVGWAFVLIPSSFRVWMSLSSIPSRSTKYGFYLSSAVHDSNDASSELHITRQRCIILAP